MEHLEPLTQYKNYHTPETSAKTNNTQKFRKDWAFIFEVACITVIMALIAVIYILAITFNPS